MVNEDCLCGFAIMPRWQNGYERSLESCSTNSHDDRLFDERIEKGLVAKLQSIVSSEFAPAWTTMRRLVFLSEQPACSNTP